MSRFWTFVLHYEINGSSGILEVKPTKINKGIKYLHDCGCVNITPKRKYYPNNVITKTLPSDLILK